MIESIKHLINEHEKELIIIEKSHDKNIENEMYGLATKRNTQAILVRRFIKDLKKLLV